MLISSTANRLDRPDDQTERIAKIDQMDEIDQIDFSAFGYIIDLQMDALTSRKLTEQQNNPHNPANPV